MNNSKHCIECKDFLGENNINDVNTYKKWLIKNHPDKFRKYGMEDNRYIDAEKKTIMMTITIT